MYTLETRVWTCDNPVTEKALIVSQIDCEKGSSFGTFSI